MGNQEIASFKQNGAAAPNNNNEINLNNYNENIINSNNNIYNKSNNNNIVSNNNRSMNVRGEISIQNDIIEKKYMIEDLGEFRNEREDKKVIRKPMLNTEDE